MVKFRCKRSGNCVSFTNENDIKGLRSHEGYEEVIDDDGENIKGEDEPEANGDNHGKEEGREKEVLKRGRKKKV